MLITESISFVDSSGATDFRNALPVAMASQYADLQISKGSPTGLGPHKCIINSVRIVSIQDLDLKVEFYGKSYGRVANTASQFNDVSELIGWTYHTRSTDSAIPTNMTGAGIASATVYASTLFASYVTGLNIPYVDNDGLGQLHINLVNTGSTAKNPGDSGLIQLRVGVIYAS